MWKDFKAFAFKGNVVDLAVGVVIGAAFGKIIKAFVDNLIMPLVSLALPSGNWRTAALTLREADPAGPEGDTRLLYGELMGSVIDFIIVAFVLFLVVRLITKAMKPKEEPAAAPTTRECPKCLEQIPLKATRCKACTSEVSPAA